MSYHCGIYLAYLKNKITFLKEKHLIYKYKNVLYQVSHMTPVALPQDHMRIHLLLGFNIDCNKGEST